LDNRESLVSISLQKWKRMLFVSATILSEHTEELSRIDGEIGDGDHGIAMAKIAVLMKDKSQYEYTNSATMFSELGWAVINVQGGCAGPLWGTFFSGMGNALALDDATCTADVFEGGLKELQTISDAKVGDKTMMDALMPAIVAMKTTLDDKKAVELGAIAACKGAEDTVNFVAKFGRARNYGERSLGVKDPGACSVALFFQGMQDGLSLTDEGEN